MTKKYSSTDLKLSKLLHRDLNSPPIVIDHANGNNLFTQDHHQLFDSVGGAAVISVGHNNKEVIDAITTQLQKVSYLHTGEFTVPIAEELAHELINNLDSSSGYSGGDVDPSKKIAKVYFANSGSEANEAAIKLVMQYFYEQGKHTKTQFISRHQSYHGNCLGGMSLSGHIARRKPYESIIDQSRFHKVDPCYEFRYKQSNDESNESSDQYVKRLLEQLENKILQIGPENVAAFFAETIVGATTGCVPATPGYFKGVREICDKYDILLVLDEIMCGSGRTGTFFAWQQEQEGEEQGGKSIIPDITTCGKAITSGYCPLSCVFFNKKILDVLSNGSSCFNCGHTYQSFPIACAAAHAVQKIIKRDNLLDNVVKMGVILQELLMMKIDPLEIVANIRGRGLFWGIEFCKNKSTLEPFNPTFNVSIKIGEYTKRNGVVVYPGKGTIDGIKGDHILIAPSFTITKEEIEFIVDIVAKSIKEFIANEVDLFK